MKCYINSSNSSNNNTFHILPSYNRKIVVLGEMSDMDLVYKKYTILPKVFTHPSKSLDSDVPNTSQVYKFKHLDMHFF